MLCTFVNCAKTVLLAPPWLDGVYKMPQFPNFPIATGGTKTIAHLSIGCLIRNLKTRRRSNTLILSSQRIGGGIFLKTFRASLFNDDLSNKPNFGRIYLFFVVDF